MPAMLWSTFLGTAGLSHVQDLAVRDSSDTQSPQRRTAVMAQTRSTSNTKISGSVSSFSHETSSSVTHRTKHSVNSNLSNSSTAHRVKSSSLDTHRTVYIVFLSLLLDLLAFTMILPLLPSLLDHYRLNDSPQGLYPWLLDKVRHFQHLVGAPDRFNSVLFGGLIEFKRPALMAAWSNTLLLQSTRLLMTGRLRFESRSGFLGSMFSFLQFVASPLVGGLSDVYGRKPVLLTCLVGIASSYVLWAFSSSFALFVLARVVGGISKGNVSLSMAIIADISTPAARGRGMALVGIAFSVGFIIGPVIGAMFAHWSHNQTGDWFVVPALFALGLGLADILFVMLCFKESLPKDSYLSSLIYYHLILMCLTVQSALYLSFALAPAAPPSLSTAGPAHSPYCLSRPRRLHLCSQRQRFLLARSISSALPILPQLSPTSHRNSVLPGRFSCLPPRLRVAGTVLLPPTATLCCRDCSPASHRDSRCQDSSLTSHRDFVLPGLCPITLQP
uniref:Major facilitator superfamily (MFS) profile domain-containing protein n=1 Tax=Timema monikensis TaxID=170555 RepID=A0A7R9HKV3_9NEOP|nr:unnamed protein product [Timema monikensis]